MSNFSSWSVLAVHPDTGIFGEVSQRLGWEAALDTAVRWEDRHGSAATICSSADVQPTIIAHMVVERGFVRSRVALLLEDA